MHVITTIDAGGAERHLLELAKLQREDSFQVIVYPLKGNSALLNSYLKWDIQVVQTGTNRNIIFQYLHILYLSFKNQFDVIHAHLPRSEILVAFLVNFHHSRFIATKHNVETILGARKSTPLSVIIARFVENRFHRIICISNFVLSFLESKKEVFRKNKWVVIHYGTSMPVGKFKPYNKIMGNPVKLVTVSRLVAQKNIPLIIQVAQMLSCSKINFLWHIYGDGPLRDLLQTDIRRFKLEKQVILAGKNTDILSILPNFDFFVLASEYEGFGFSILEALSCGLPVIVSRTPTSIEILGDSYVGLFDLKSPQSLLSTLFRFISNDNDVEKLSEDLTRIYLQYNSSNMYEQTKNIYFLERK